MATYFRPNCIWMTRRHVIGLNSKPYLWCMQSLRSRETITPKKHIKRTGRGAEGEKAGTLCSHALLSLFVCSCRIIKRLRTKKKRKISNISLNGSHITMATHKKRTEFKSILSWWWSSSSSKAEGHFKRKWKIRNGIVNKSLFPCTTVIAKRMWFKVTTTTTNTMWHLRSTRIHTK